MQSVFFEVEGGAAAEGGTDSEVLLPQPWAYSQWGDGSSQIRGPAVSGALARAAERAVRSIDSAAALRPVRWTLDLFRPATIRPCVVATTLVRRGRRLCLIDAVLTQCDTPVARATALFLAHGGPVHGAAWAPRTMPCAPPPDLRPTTTEHRLYYSEGVGWTGSPGPHQNAERKQVWNLPAVVVRGETPTAFQQAAIAADLVSMVTNWGDQGLEFINADVTLALARPPESLEVGLAAEHRIEDDGIAVGTATVFDRQGTFGTATVTALANAANAVDPRLAGDPL